MPLKDVLQEYFKDPANLSATELYEKHKDELNGSPLKLVELLGEYLTSTDVTLRGVATCLLSDMLSCFNELNPAELSVLTDFYCNRVKDQHSVIPHVVTGFLALTERAEFPDGCSVSIVHALGQDVYVPTLKQSYRAKSYQIISNLLRLKLTELQSMPGFIKNWILIIDAEKDPRNLLTVFNISFTVINNFTLGEDAEELFEVTSCYFPIDFTPPPDEEFPVTRADLSLWLRRVMSGSHHFAPYCIPLIIEKLSSDLESAKQDSLKTLEDCCIIYTIEELRPHLKILTSLLQKETLLSNNTQTEQCAYHAITSITQCLNKPTRDGAENYDDLGIFCEALLRDCKHHLLEPEQKLVAPSIKTLQCLISSSIRASRLILPVLLDVSSAASDKNIQVSKLKAFLHTEYQLLSVAQEVDNNIKLRLLPHYTELIEHSDRTVVMVTQSCLQLVCSVYTEQEVMSMCNKLLQLLNQTDNEQFVKVTCTCLSVLYKNHPSILQSELLTKNFQLISNSTEYPLYIILVLEYISVNSPHVADDIFERLIHAADNLIPDGDFSRLTVFLTSLINILNKTTLTIKQFYIVSLITSCYHSELSTHDLSLLNELIILLTIKSEISVQIDTKETLSRERFIQILSKSERYVQLLQVFYCSLHRTVKFSDSNMVTLRDTLLNTADDVNINNYTSVCKIYSSILNKSTEVESEITPMVSYLKSVTVLNKYEIILLSWISKSVVLSNHPTSNLLIDILLSHVERNSKVSSVFEVILKDDDDCLTKRQHAVVRLMYKQRLFTLTFNKLYQLFNTASSTDTDLQCVCDCLAYLIRYVPTQVILHEKQKITRIILELLSSKRSDVLLTALNVLREDTSILSNELDTIIPKLLNNTQHANNIEVRLASLKCITSLTNLETYLIYPHMNRVIKGLIPALDDHKRLVRHEAVNARNKWCLARDGE